MRLSDVFALLIRNGHARPHDLTLDQIRLYSEAAMRAETRQRAAFVVDVTQAFGSDPGAHVRSLTEAGDG